MYLSIHKLSNSILSTEPSFRSKNVFIDTQIYHTLFPLPINGKSKCVSIYTQSYQTLYYTKLSNSILHKAIKLYPTQRYQTLSYMKLSNSILHKAIELYPTRSYQTLSYTKLSNSILHKAIKLIPTRSYQTLFSLTNKDMSNYVFIDTQSYQTLFSLPSNGSSNCRVNRVYIQLTIFGYKGQIKIKLTNYTDR